MQQPCVPCTKSEVDLESAPPLQITTDDYLVCTGPKSGPESSGSLEFLIHASSDDYLDLSHCYLYLKCLVLKADGSHIETLKTDTSQGADTSLGPVNLLFHSLFRQVATSGETYSYRAYLTMLLSYERDAKEIWLRHLEGCQMDKDGKYDAQENISPISRREMIANSRPFDFKGRLHSDMLLQERLVPNNVNVRLVLLCG